MSDPISLDGWRPEETTPGPRGREKPMIWVLFDTTSGDVVLCGTTLARKGAVKWSNSRDKRGAVLLPLGGLADGEIL